MSKRKRHSPEQTVRKLQEADRLLNAGKSVAHVYQALEVSEATYHRWRNQYGGMKCEEAKRLKSLEMENARLKKLLAEASVAVSPGVGFGEYGEGFVRFGLIENEHRTRQAIRNIKRMMKNDGITKVRD